MIFTRENYWQIASLMTQKSLFTVTHALFFISCTINTMATVVQVTHTARASAAMLLTWFSWNIMVSAPEQLIKIYPLKPFDCSIKTCLYIDRLVHERCNSSAFAVELRLSCTNPSIYEQHCLIHIYLYFDEFKQYCLFVAFCSIIMYILFPAECATIGRGSARMPREKTIPK